MRNLPAWHALRSAAACGAALWMTSGSATAQAPADEDLRARVERIEKDNKERIDRLERENRELRESLQEVRRAVPAAGEEATPTAAVGGGADAPASQRQVEAIVGQYLRKRDAEKEAAAEAKKAAEAAEFKPVGGDLSMKAVWRDGLHVETANGDFRVHVGGQAQVDAAFFDPSQSLKNAFPKAPTGLAPAWQDGADFRRARLRVDGDAYEIMSWVAEVDFAQGNGNLGRAGFTNPAATVTAGQLNINTPQLTDFYAEVHKLPWVGNVRVGHQKEPYNLEDFATPDPNLTFMERSLVNDAFFINRHIGVSAYNTAFDKRVVWQAGLFRSAENVNSGNVFDYEDGAYAETARIGILPYYAAGGRYVVFLGGAYSHRTYDPGVVTDNVTFAARPSVRVNAPNLVSTGALSLDSIDYYNAEVAVVAGPFSLQGEYYNYQANNIRRGFVGKGVDRLVEGDFDGFYVEASYFLTGENRVYNPDIGGWGTVRPYEPFYFVRRGENGSCGSILGKGAWQATFRYDYLSLLSPALDGFPSTRQGRTVVGAAIPGVPTAGMGQDWVVGLNWYLNPNLRMYFDYIHARRGVQDRTLSGSENTFATRLALVF